MSLNFAPDELQKFSQLASEWWSLTGPLKTLHAINPLRLQFIQERASLKNAKVIDVGCGGGILTESMAHAGATVTGIDLSEDALKVAQAHWQNNPLAQTNPNAIHYELIAAETIAEKHSGAYDIVTCMELLEHVPDPMSTIQACAKLVKPGGHLFFSTINRNPKAYLFAVLGAEYLLGMLPKGTHDFAKFIKPSELANWARQADLTAREFMGLHYNPLKRTYYVNKDISVNYLFHCQREI